MLHVLFNVDHILRDLSRKDYHQALHHSFLSSYHLLGALQASFPSFIMQGLLVPV